MGIENYLEFLTRKSNHATWKHSQCFFFFWDLYVQKGISQSTINYRIEIMCGTRSYMDFVGQKKQLQKVRFFKT